MLLCAKVFEAKILRWSVECDITYSKETNHQILLDLHIIILHAVVQMSQNWQNGGF